MQLKRKLKSVIILYVMSWVLFFVGIVLLIFFRSSLTLVESINRFVELLDDIDFLKTIHVLFAFIYIVYLLAVYFFRVYKKRGFYISLKQFGIRLIGPIFLLVIVYKLIVFNNTNEDYKYSWDYSVENTSGKSKNRYSIDGKHRGMHIFGFGKNNEEDISDLIKTNVEWAAVVPFIYQKNEQSKEMSVPDSIGDWTRRDSSFVKIIDQFHSKGLRVMLKPHIWLSDGWRSNINLPSEEAWSIWFESYRKNMIHYAKLAEQIDIELFCIGTELRSSLKQQPKAWDSLIKEIKGVYSGKLTYAANWDDENESFTFWKELDYIGIQAYFPLTETKNPDLETIKKGWKQHVIKLDAMSKKHDKPILFTEVGYKSEASATVDPWEWNSFFSKLNREKSSKTQQLAYEALFQNLWKKDWFAGVYIWQWSFRSQKENAQQNLDFSPRFKPAENTMSKWFYTNQ